MLPASARASSIASGRLSAGPPALPPRPRRRLPRLRPCRRRPRRRARRSQRRPPPRRGRGRRLLPALHRGVDDGEALRALRLERLALDEVGGRGLREVLAEARLGVARPRLLARARLRAVVLPVAGGLAQVLLDVVHEPVRELVGADPLEALVDVGAERGVLLGDLVDAGRAVGAVVLAEGGAVGDAGGRVGVDRVRRLAEVLDLLGVVLAGGVVALGAEDRGEVLARLLERAQLTDVPVALLDLHQLVGRRLGVAPLGRLHELAAADPDPVAAADPLDDALRGGRLGVVADVHRLALDRADLARDELRRRAVADRALELERLLDVGLAGHRGHVALDVRVHASGQRRGATRSHRGHPRRPTLRCPVRFGQTEGPRLSPRGGCRACPAARRPRSGARRSARAGRWRARRGGSWRRRPARCAAPRRAAGPGRA